MTENANTRFLIIESDPIILKALTQVAIMVGAGYVLPCSSTIPAAEALAKDSFSFIFCRDHLTPESGCQFIARQRAQDRQTPVVFVSSRPAAENILAAAAIDQAEFLSLPFSLADLNACMFRLTNTHHA